MTRPVSRDFEIFAPLSAGWPDLLTRRVTGPVRARGVL